jgi:hypothetical protein
MGFQGDCKRQVRARQRDKQKRSLRDKATLNRKRGKITSYKRGRWD